MSKKYSSSARLSKSMSAREAAQAIMKSLIPAIEDNADGIMNRQEKESVHDFRVCIRRLRTLLGKFKHVFPKETVKPLKGSLSRAGKISGRIRDIDVHLSRRDEYLSMLPEHMRPGLEAFFGILEEMRRSEYETMLSELGSKNFSAMMRSLHELAGNSTALAETENSSSPVKQAAKLVIVSMFRKILICGFDADDKTDDAELHRIRISCKHLRYMLEFFSSLFPVRETGRIVSKLKLLQDRLGAYNDLSVLHMHILVHLKKADQYGKISAMHAASLGGLIVALNSRKKSERNLIMDALKDFCTDQQIRELERKI